MAEVKYITRYGDYYGVLALGANLSYTAPAEGGVTATANRAEIEAQIAAFEPEYLQRLLGEGFASEVYEYLRRADVSQAEERMDVLLSLLRGGDGGISPAACYVYFRILETRRARVTETGVWLGADKGDTASPIPHQVQAWGLMVNANVAVMRYVREFFADKDVRPHPAMFERVNSMGL